MIPRVCGPSVRAHVDCAEGEQVSPTHLSTPASMLHQVVNGYMASHRASSKSLDQAHSCDRGVKSTNQLILS